MDFYFWVDKLWLIVLIALAIISLELLVRANNIELSKKIVFWPCMLCASLSAIILFGHISEIYVAYYSGAKYEWEAFKLRMTGPYWYFYVLIMLSVFAPMLLFFSYFRKSASTIFILALLALSFYLWDNYYLIFG